MTEVWFYHLERSGLNEVLPELLEKTLARGWRALVRAPGAERIEHLDAWLWSYRNESFLPHGLADEPQAERQPILLSTEADNRNAAQALFLLEGAELGTVDGYERCLILFDGRDDEALAIARKQWTQAKAGGYACAYWRQAARGWEKQA
ncbi:MAG TPA: DNA polymerase III subunit chi [Phenylobacterium sp.]